MSHSLLPHPHHTHVSVKEVKDMNIYMTIYDYINVLIYNNDESDGFL